MKKQTCAVDIIAVSLLALLFVFAARSHAAPPNAGQITQRQVQVIAKPERDTITNRFNTYGGGPVTRVHVPLQFCADGFKYIQTSPIGPGLPPPKSVCDGFLSPCHGWVDNSPILGGFICRFEGDAASPSNYANSCFMGAKAIGGGDYGEKDANDEWKKVGIDVCCAFIGDPGQDCQLAK